MLAKSDGVIGSQLRMRALYRVVTVIIIGGFCLSTSISAQTDLVPVKAETGDHLFVHAKALIFSTSSLTVPDAWGPWTFSLLDKTLGYRLQRFAVSDELNWAAWNIEFRNSGVKPLKVEWSYSPRVMGQAIDLVGDEHVRDRSGRIYILLLPGESQRSFLWIKGSVKPDIDLWSVISQTPFRVSPDTSEALIDLVAKKLLTAPDLFHLWTVARFANNNPSNPRYGLGKQPKVENPELLSHVQALDLYGYEIKPDSFRLQPGDILVSLATVRDNANFGDAIALVKGYNQRDATAALILYDTKDGSRKSVTLPMTEDKPDASARFVRSGVILLRPLDSDFARILGERIR